MPLPITDEEIFSAYQYYDQQNVFDRNIVNPLIFRDYIQAGFRDAQMRGETFGNPITQIFPLGWFARPTRMVVDRNAPQIIVNELQRLHGFVPITIGPNDDPELVRLRNYARNTFGFIHTMCVGFLFIFGCLVIICNPGTTIFGGLLGFIVYSAGRLALS